ncbi:hypothetical protein D9619_008003 [Psilocybe cf. subviscida]|uniref:Uncharacterized protein n=1 Tax=Psilocybe cf. subviscida TaxID=2480587 RepID=A0A8H5ATW3_9AGAR|nr:hypothetical protein D9619_008003 [Psilocybe cf. subviscida]
MTDLHLREASTSTPSSPKDKPPPNTSKTSGASYAPSDDGTDENMLILMHGLGGRHLPTALQTGTVVEIATNGGARPACPGTGTIPVFLLLYSRIPLFKHASRTAAVSWLTESRYARMPRVATYYVMWGQRRRNLPASQAAQSPDLHRTNFLLRFHPI